MLMRGEDMMRQPDPFWDVKAREAAEVDALNRDIINIQQQIEVAKRVEAVRHAPGFQDLLVAMKGLHAIAREKLVGDGTLNNDGLREQRGRVRGIESVLALFTSAVANTALASQLAERKNQLVEVLRRRPKQPKSEDPTEVKS